jgi:carbamoyl-phosphate synthase large subunit
MNTDRSPVRLLVTGCGGDIGQSIGKIAASEQTLFSPAIGCDVGTEHSGIFVFPEFVKICPCSAADYTEELAKLVRAHSVDAIVPTSEPEIKFLLKSGLLDDIAGAKVILPSGQAMRIGFDKLETVRFLESVNLPAPKTAVLKDVAATEYPAILKSREGAGSKSVFKVESDLDFRYYKEKYPDYLLQEYLRPDNEEYTCGLFRSSRGEIRTITFRRKLHGDLTGYGETVQRPEIDALLRAIAEKLCLVGSINVQLRLTNRGPIVFEINPRFSSTVFFRHLLGFQDFVWCVRERFDMAIPEYNAVSEGRRIYRGYTEFVR